MTLRGNKSEEIAFVMVLAYTSRCPSGLLLFFISISAPLSILPSLTLARVKFLAVLNREFSILMSCLGLLSHGCQLHSVLPTDDCYFPAVLPFQPIQTRPSPDELTTNNITVGIRSQHETHIYSGPNEVTHSFSLNLIFTKSGS